MHLEDGLPIFEVLMQAAYELIDMMHLGVFNDFLSSKVVFPVDFDLVNFIPVVKFAEVPTFTLIFGSGLTLIFYIWVWKFIHDIIDTITP